MFFPQMESLRGPHGQDLMAVDPYTTSGQYLESEGLGFSRPEPTPLLAGLSSPDTSL